MSTTPYPFSMHDAADRSQPAGRPSRTRRLHPVRTCREQVERVAPDTDDPVHDLAYWVLTNGWGTLVCAVCPALRGHGRTRGVHLGVYAPEHAQMLSRFIPYMSGEELLVAMFEHSLNGCAPSTRDLLVLHRSLTGMGVGQDPWPALRTLAMALPGVSLRRERWDGANGDGIV